MSKNKKEIKKFISNVKSSYVLVNILPNLQDDINIDINDLLYRKDVLMWESNK